MLVFNGFVLKTGQRHKLLLRYFCPMIRMERLSAADAGMLAKVGGISLLESHGHSAPEQVMQAYVERSFSEEACRKELLDENNLFYAAFYKEQPAGYFKIIYDSPHPMVPLQPVTKLERLYLLKEFYDLKLGHQLLEKAVVLSKAKGDRGMWLDVWKKNERAIRFYQKQGFDVAGESAFILTETHTNLTWVMLLRY